MPEMPEVETVRRDLSAVLNGKKLAAFVIFSKETASHPAAFFEKNLVGRKLAGISRRGKLLIFSWSGDSYLLIHLKMTGQLIYESRRTKIAGGHSRSDESYEKSVGGQLPNKHTRAALYFSGGSRLFFNDLRRFGYIKLVDKDGLDKIIADSYGPEPLSADFSAAYLSGIMKGRKANIKSVLLNQKIVAGLGNIYVDEALFAAKIDPRRRAGKVRPEEIKRLVRETNQVIRRAIAGRGTTFSDYVDSRGKKGNFSRRLKVYGRDGQNCPVCGRMIIKIKVAGRGTHYCSYCQK